MKYLIIIISILISACSAIHTNQEVLTIVSESTTSNIQPLIASFEEAYGVQVKLIANKDMSLLDFLPKSNADVILTSVSEELEIAKNKHLLIPFEDFDINSKIYSRFKDPDSYWIGYAYRLRSVFYNLNIPVTTIPKNYEDLIKSDWKGKICTRNLDQKYSYALIAWLIETRGREYTKLWIKGMYDNKAVEPIGRDKDQVLKLAQQKCDIAIANSYYYSELLHNEATRKDIVDHVGIMLQNQSSDGAFPLVNGMAIIKDTKHVELANKFVQYLVNSSSQYWLSSIPSFYPVRSDIPLSILLESYGSSSRIKTLPVVNQSPISKIAAHYYDAIDLIHQGGFISKE